MFINSVFEANLFKYNANTNYLYSAYHCTNKVLFNNTYFLIFIMFPYYVLCVMYNVSWYVI